MAKHHRLFAFGLATLLAGVAGAEGANISVSSSAFKNQGAIPSEYTCEGKSTAPPLSWGEVPAATKSVAIIVKDPDAPSGTFEHLAAFNLPPTRRSLTSDALQSIGPGSALKTAKNSAGQSGFAPICPPSGTHHYHFVVMALDNVLDVMPGAGAADVEKAAMGHVLARGELIGTYSSRR